MLAILCIVSICSIVYCCRKWKNRALTKGFRNFSAYGPNMIGNTLDRKAMLETSSDNSDPLRSHISYDGPGLTSVNSLMMMKTDDFDFFYTDLLFNLIILGGSNIASRLQTPSRK